METNHIMATEPIPGNNVPHNLKGQNSLQDPYSTPRMDPNNYPERYQYSFGKRKSDFDYFNPGPNVEEIPTFSFENDKNLNTYKVNINAKSKLIDEYSKNYLEYLKKFEDPRRKTPSNVYDYFQNKAQYNPRYRLKSNPSSLLLSKSQDTCRNVNNPNSTQIYEDKYNINIITDNTYENIRKKNGLSNNIPYSKEPLVNNNLFVRNNEITNPDKYFKNKNQEYHKYKSEQKNYMDYNYQMMMEKKKRKYDGGLIVNPYNSGSDSGALGKSVLSHNTILNPSPYFNYNKYITNNNNSQVSNTLANAAHNFISN